MTLSHPHLIRHQITLDAYHRMIEAGILTERDKVELLDGEIIQMSPKGTKHTACVRKINRWLVCRIDAQFDVRPQNPIQIPNLSEPEPDLAIVWNRADFYRDAHPLPKDVIMLIEVADSSLQVDREVKLPLYAAAGIQHYWIINLPEQQIEVHHTPQGNRYQESRVAKLGETVQIPFVEMETRVEDWLV